MIQLKQYVMSVVLMMAALNAHAEFYMDCDKAVSQVEKRICNNKSLWKLDGKLNRHYDSALSRSDEPGKIRLEQRSWIKEIRDRCKDDDCLNDVYNDRIKHLSQLNFIDPYCGENVYPPYPDVWSYDAAHDGASMAGIYLLPTGKVWGRYVIRGGGEYIQCFFSNRQMSIKHPEKIGFSAYESILTLELGGLQLPNGSVLTKHHAYSGSRCDSGFGSYIEKIGSDGVVEKRITILILLKAPIERPVDYCDGELNTVKTYVINAIPSEIVSLADNTLLVMAGQFDHPLVIRFDSNLKTKFSSDHVLVANWDDIDRLYSQSSNYQDLADHVRQYVIQKLEEKN